MSVVVPVIIGCVVGGIVVLSMLRAKHYQRLADIEKGTAEYWETRCLQLGNQLKTLDEKYDERCREVCDLESIINRMMAIAAGKEAHPKQ